LLFLVVFSATGAGAAATGAGAAGASDFLETRLVAVEDLFIVLLPVVFWDIFKRAMPIIVFKPSVKFYDGI
jgi:hypothetical protein